jgi:hypothetical protein
MRRLLLLIVCMLSAVCLKAQSSVGTQGSVPSGSPVQPTFLGEPAPQAMNPLPSAAEVCEACKKNCVDAREQCQVSACLINGGTPDGVVCDTVTSQNGWSDGLKACSDQETACDKKCSVGVCRQ